MYRPDRIGPYAGLFDVDLAKPSWPTEWNTNLNNVDGDHADFKPHFYTDTVRDDFDQLTWSEPSTTLAAGKTFCAAVALNGENISELPMHFSGAVQVRVDATEIMLAAFAGRLDAAVDVTRNATNNNVANPLILHNDLGGSISWLGQFLTVDQEVDGYGTNPICLGVQLYNPTGSNVSLDGLFISVNAHRWLEDIQTFDPTR